MEDSLIAFPTAKLAKKKRFDEGCEWYYLSTDKEKKQVIGLLKGHPDEKGGKMTNTYLGPVRFSAPTQSHLQRWLREVHNLHLTIRYIPDEPLSRYELSFPGTDLTYKEIFLTYEAALENGLETLLFCIPDIP